MRTQAPLQTAAAAAKTSLIDNMCSVLILLPFPCHVPAEPWRVRCARPAQHYMYVPCGRPRCRPRGHASTWMVCPEARRPAFEHSTHLSHLSTKVWSTCFLAALASVSLLTTYRNKNSYTICARPHLLLLRGGGVPTCWAVLQLLLLSTQPCHKHAFSCHDVIVDGRMQSALGCCVSRSASKLVEGSCVWPLDGTAVWPCDGRNITSGTGAGSTACYNKRRQIPPALLYNWLLLLLMQSFTQACFPVRIYIRTCYAA
jgi:hypothetical protein